MLVRIVSAPGLWVQRITTKEPTDDMIEVAICSLKASLPEIYPECRSTEDSTGTGEGESTAQSEENDTESAEDGEKNDAGA